MIRSRRRAAPALALTLALAPVAPTPSPARPIAAGTATDAVVVRHVDPHPQSPRATRILLARLGRAAMEACGASSFSLREVKASVRGSACWRGSMADALTRIGDPALAEAYDRAQTRHRG